MNAPTRQSVEEVIAACLHQLRDDLDLPPLEKVTPETPLLGSGSDLDSMALVHFVADLEERLRCAFGKDWILADERALSRSRSPFRTVGDLVAFIEESAPE